VTKWQQTLEVAHWEFRRFVKWKQQLVGFAIIIVLGFGGGFVGRMVKRVDQRAVPVAAIGAERLGYALPSVPPVEWDSSQAWTESTARAAVDSGSLRGVLIIDGPTSMRLVMPKRAGWAESLERGLNSARQVAMLTQLAASSPEGAAMLVPLDLKTEFLAAGAARTEKSTRIAAMAILFLGFTLVMGGFGTLFAGITGEKQHRVTEQMIAIVPPQVWMDGKIIGLAGAAAIGTAVTTLGIITIFRLLPKMLGRASVELPPIVSDYGTLALVILITLLGVAMWFSFMAAIAATIDDPNSSTRTLLLFLPMLPMGLAFTAAQNADSMFARVLGLFPLTATAALPMRLVITTVPWWETLLSIVLIVGAVWLFRRAAGKIFGTAVLMYGKEPTFREMWRWMREA
jgi:ABC-2 type transport system permease protein